VQVVLGRLGLDVPGLVREVRARRVDPLTTRLEHRRDGVLREPVELEIRVQLHQLVGDRHVALGMPEADRRRDEQGPLGPRPAADPPARAAGSDEVAQQEIHLDRVAGLRDVAGALERHKLSGGRPRELLTAPVRTDRVLVTVDH
jgi:hypothetical protein